MRIKLRSKTLYIKRRDTKLKNSRSQTPNPAATALPPEAARPVAARDEGNAASDERPVKFTGTVTALASEPPRHSFTEHRNEVLGRLGYPDEYPRSFRPAVVELASIITEVEMLDGYCLIGICGEQLPAGLVADVLRELTPDHIMRVLEDYRTRPEIKRKRQYLRSMLYNSVMELEGDTLREVYLDYFAGTESTTSHN